MTSTARRRVAKLEGALLPREAVLAWLAEAQQFPNIVDPARSTADLPVEAAPLSVISARVVAAVRESFKGQARDETERVARRERGGAIPGVGSDSGPAPCSRPHSPAAWRRVAAR